MMSARWISSRMLEFNFLPSCTLHRSRWDVFSPPGVSGVLLDQPIWRASWHRHWSRSILRQLALGPVEHPAGELMLALLPQDGLARLAERVAMVLCSETLRRAISGDAVRAMELRLGKDLVDFGRREATRYAQQLPMAGQTVIPGTLKELEALGQSILLAGVSTAEPAVLRRFELKLPLDIRESDSPLPAVQAWPLCVAVLKDMDPIWCSSFPEIL